MTKPEKISVQHNQLQVPDFPIIPFIAGDGIGPEIWTAAKKVFDAAVDKAYQGTKQVIWKQYLAGQAAYDRTGEWLPAKTIAALKDYLVSIKGPLTTPIGKGHRSLNVTLRQELDLFACVRPVEYFAGSPSPVKYPGKVSITVFRENTEDIYAGIDFAAQTPAADELLAFLKKYHQFAKVRFPDTSAFAIKPVSSEGSKRLVKAAIQYAIDHHLQTVTLVHKGNIMKKTEGGFKNWGYQAAQEFKDQVFTMEEYTDVLRQAGYDEAQVAQARAVKAGKIIVNDLITDNFFQQSLLHPEKFDVVATLNLNGDYISDALAAQVGGIGIAPGANINYQTKRAIFEATHGTAPQFAGQNKLNPTSMILSGVMMFEYLGWQQAADLIKKAVSQAIADQHVTVDFAKALPDAVELSTSGFASYLAALIEQN
ncbi:NADP-dependent isocitrate dehydrogenase [Liquorilactobacillus vini]|uniref:Isocitrate dehydrogenase [NADP] n=1 Tax=Liquorilactobacillus vini DSM 20605 TaxID=1133569 RepID=A0A0R2CCW6_9LACO|nr:NADP-dependent isocitrate dehydrogenase [Liquorilactobacillus vini]KRM89601.1 Isocitrate dehydrogenase [Liquorilactobacillus vini DSM 20605]